MEIFSIMRSPYRMVINDKWKNLPQELDDKTKLLFPMTTNNDTALHLAVYSKEDEPTRTLLKAISQVGQIEFWKNRDGNTPLHEATTVGNLAAVKLLVEHNKNDLLAENIYGETPLFIAARFGHLDILNYFLEDCEEIFSQSPMNWTDGDGVPILHATIRSEKFEAAVKLVEFDKSLLEMKDPNDKTALYNLAAMPFAFKSGSDMKFFEKTIYKLIPNEDIDKYKLSNFGSFGTNDSKSSSNNEDKKKNEDLEAQRGALNRGHNFCGSNYWKYFVKCFKCSLWRHVFRAWPRWKETYRQKRQHRFGLKLTRRLAQIDYSWREFKSKLPENAKKSSTDPIGEGDEEQVKSTPPENYKKSTPIREEEELNIHRIHKTEQVAELKLVDIDYEDDHEETPIILAAANGIIEIVKEIANAHPQAVDHVTLHQRNLLHVAIAHRQLEIFKWINKRKFMMKRLVRRIDEFGFTALHQVGATHFYRGGTRGPALELQQELKWYYRVEDVIPTLYKMHESKMKSTAWQLFNETHDKMLEDGKEWLKKTSEACSAVAVLVATVVFTAAYTVPGGLNDKTGSPILLSEPIFMVFTVMDIIGLATSLTSVVMFLSILTSSFKMKDFHYSLPLKLSCGFQLLFLSVGCTMMAFALTIVLTLKTEQMKWTMSLLYIATFFPVMMFVIIQLPLFVELTESVWYFRRILFKILPTGLVPTKFFKRIFPKTKI